MSSKNARNAKAEIVRRDVKEGGESQEFDSPGEVNEKTKWSGMIRWRWCGEDRRPSPHRFLCS